MSDKNKGRIVEGSKRAGGKKGKPAGTKPEINLTGQQKKKNKSE